MRVPETIDRTAWELRMEVGSWKRSRLYRIGLAVQAAGAADSDDAAQELLWSGVEVLQALGHPGPTVREALELQSVDVSAVVGCLQQLDEHFEQVRYEDELDKLREISWALPLAAAPMVGVNE